MRTIAILFRHRALRIALSVFAVMMPAIPADALSLFCHGAIVTPCDPNDPKSSCYVPPPPSCKCQPKTCKKCTTSPGFVGSGIYETSVVDLSIPTAGFPLMAERRYNSGHAIDGPTGIGWSSGFHARLHYTTYLFAAPSTYSVEADVIMPDGEHYVFSSNGSGIFTAPEGRYDTLVQNGDGTFDLTLQRSRSKLRFAADGTLASMTDDYGNALSYTYDGSGRLQQMSDAAGSGRYLNVYWGPNGRISTIQDHIGRTVQYGYDTDGMLTTVTNPAGQTTTYSYVAGRLSKMLSRVSDHWGRVVSDITWDAQGRVTSYSENGDTFTYTYSYQNIATQTAKSDGAGNTWVYPFQEDGLIGERRPPAASGGTASFTTYNTDGSIAIATDEMGVKTYYTYAGAGRVASVTKDYQGASAVRFDYAYDSAFPDKVVSILAKNVTTGANEPNWQGWKYDYHQAGSVAPGSLHHVYRVRDDGVTTDTVATYTYDAKGRVVSVTDASGAVTDYVYDTTGNLASVTAPANNTAGTRPVTSYAYDTLGRVTSVTDPLAKITTYTYDALDRIATMTLPKPSAGSSLVFATSYSYDNWDSATSLLLTHVTDPNGIITKQGYDPFGRLRKSIDAATQTTSYSYTRDLLSSITDANGNVTGYEYDVLKRLSATVFPDAARESYAYRADGLLASKTDRKNQAISFTYDAQKRLTRKTYPNSAYVQYTYTGQKMTQVYDTLLSPAETHAFTYDSTFRMASNTQGPRGTIGYTYNTSDAVATMSVTSGPSTTYSYFADGSLNTINWSPVSGAFQTAYRLNGQYQSITMPSGQSRGYSYDDQGRLLQIANTHPATGNLATFDYSYDLNHATSAYTRMGQRVSMTANVPAHGQTAALTKYHYDPNYQLTKAEYPAVAPFNGEVHDWSYDAIGNRLTSAMNGGTATTYTYQKIGANPNNWQRLLTAGGPTHAYDANGNTTGDGTSTFGWDYENRMTSIAGGATATYKYDYQGRRISKTVSGTTTTYLYDGLNLIAEVGATPTDYVFGTGIDEALALNRAGNVSYYSVDGLGSVALVTDASGATQNSYTYDAWGAARSTTEAVPQPFRYTAREVGDLGSQSFYRARFYAPPVGRFLSEDPLNDYIPLIGAALYSYVSSNPVNWDDPLGLAKCSMIVKYGPARREIEWSNEWRLSSVRTYPQINRVTPKNAIGRIIGAKKPAAASFGFTRIDCRWTKYFVSTEYLRQDWTLVEICKCPDSRRTVGSGVDEDNLGEITRAIDSARTFGSFGFAFTPCPRPTF